MSNTSNKILSVSIAAYNAEQYIREVLDSFVGIPQMDALEVFVVDDGGTDSTLKIAQEYQAKYPQTFIAVHKENGGWGSTVNYSIQRAHGKYFKLLDGDDYYDSQNLSRFIEYLKKIDADIVNSPYTTFDDKTGNKVETICADHLLKENVLYELERLENNFPLAMHSLTVRTDLLQTHNIRVKERCLYRDMEFTARCIDSAKTIMFFNDPVYFYRLGREGQSVSKSSYLKHIDEHADIVCCILDISKNSTPNKRRILYNLAEGTCIQQYIIYFYTSNNQKLKPKLIEFDNRIKEFPAFYNNIKLPKHINILKKINFIGYEFVMMLLGIKRRIQNK